MKRIYLDHAAATPLSQKALAVMINTMKKFPGNPSAIHREGRESRKALEDAREKIASALSAHLDEILFVSGATEANNLALLGIVREAKMRGNMHPHIIISTIEHPAVIETARNLEKHENVRLDVLSVDNQGLVDVRELRKLITPETVLVSVMYANNEIGTVEPITDIAKEIRHARKMNKSVYPFFHTDAAQAANFLDINVLRLGVDFMTLSSSKTYGPRGVGVLFVRRGVMLQPIMFGGKQEKGKRPGTESPALAQGFATSLLEARKLSEKESKRIQVLRNLLATQIIKKVSGSTVNGRVENSLPNMLNVSILGTEGDALVLYLDAAGIAVSGQSACKSSEDGPSHVIMAIGKADEGGTGVVRFSLGRSTTREDILYVVDELLQVVSLLRETRAKSDTV